MPISKIFFITDIYNYGSIAVDKVNQVIWTNRRTTSLSLIDNKRYKQEHKHTYQDVMITDKFKYLGDN